MANNLKEIAEKAKELTEPENIFLYKGEEYKFQSFLPAFITMINKDGKTIKFSVFDSKVDEFVLVSI